MDLQLWALTLQTNAMVLNWFFVGLLLYMKELEGRVEPMAMSTAQQIYVLCLILAYNIIGSGLEVCSALHIFPMALMFAQITPQTFLTTLVETPASLGGNLKLSSKDWESYQQLTSNLPDVRAFLKSIAVKRSAQ
ncbi:hypothetical protein F5051DRAFT_447203 [Lentinula edodes]|nr:hypothetical protein F5051DRAFT_447203 [Lentinula edodes]